MNNEALRRPHSDEYHQYYASYIACVPEGELFDLLTQQIESFQNCLQKISDEDALVLHDPYTWTIKQVIGHLIDAEKLFGWRAHRFGCGDETPLPGMDQNPYIEALDYNTPTVQQLADELEQVRRSNLSFLRRLPEKGWNRTGIAGGNPMTVRALAYMLVGHINHHMHIVEQRLGLD